MADVNYSKIKIHPPGTRQTDSETMEWLRKNTPEALGLVKKILVVATKYLKGGGLFSSKEKKRRELEEKIYKLEKLLRSYKFREIQFYTEGPINVLIAYFSIVSDALPNWQKEYELLNNFIPNCNDYSDPKNKEWYEMIKSTPSKEAFEIGILQNEFGDYVYPGEEGYEELLKQHKKR